MKRNKDRKNSIFDVVSNAPEIEFQAELPMLGAAKNNKKAGRSIEGRYCCLINADESVIKSTIQCTMPRKTCKQRSLAIQSVPLLAQP